LRVAMTITLWCLLSHSLVVLRVSIVSTKWLHWQVIYLSTLIIPWAQLTGS